MDLKGECREEKGVGGSYRVGMILLSWEKDSPPVPSTLSISKSSDDTLLWAGSLWFTVNGG